MGLVSAATRGHVECWRFPVPQGDAPAGGPLDELKSAMITLSGGEGIPFPEAQLPELLGLVDASVGAVISAVFAELSAGTEPASASVDGMIDVCVHLVCLYPHPVRQRTVL